MEKVYVKMIQEYKILNNSEESSQWFRECKDKRIVNLFALTEKDYTKIEWDYYSLREFLQFENLNNCNYKTDIEDLHSQYISTNTISKNKQILNIQDGIGLFYVKNKDTVVMIEKMAKIFDNMITSNCMDAIPVEEIEIPEELKNLFPMYN